MSVPSGKLEGQGGDMSLTNEHAALVIRAFKGISTNPDQCFTCFDITKATRSLTDDNIRHNEVRELVHALFDQGLLNVYNRIDHTFWDDSQGQNITAKLFVPPAGDPYAYDPSEVKMVKLDDLDSDELDILLEDGEGNPLLTMESKSDQKDEAEETDADPVVVIDGPDNEVIKIHTNDSIIDRILKKVAVKLPKWW